MVECYTAYFRRRVTRTSRVPSKNSTQVGSLLLIDRQVRQVGKIYYNCAAQPKFSTFLNPKIEIMTAIMHRKKWIMTLIIQ